MSKEIEVYNTYFGDCIMLKNKDDDSNLLVDFGIHYFSDGKTSLLITHFHEDHISGLIDMNKSAQCKYKGLFKNI